MPPVPRLVPRATAAATAVAATARPTTSDAGRVAGAAPAVRRPLLVAALGGVGALVAAALARPGSGWNRSADRRLRGALRGRGRGWAPAVHRAYGRAGRINTALGGLSGEAPTLAAGTIAAVAVGLRRGRRAALPVLAAVPVALAAHAAIKYALRRPRPLTARLTGKHTPSFPSGHAARGAAAAGIVGYLAVREWEARPALALPLGVVAAAVGGSARVFVERHWASDAAGGWGIGLTTAALCALWYEQERERGVGAAPRRRPRH